MSQCAFVASVYVSQLVCLCCVLQFLRTEVSKKCKSVVELHKVGQ